MQTPDIQNPLFRQAVETIDAGDIVALEKLLISNPELITDRLSYSDGGYFKDPYLIWFVADNPIRIGKLPKNIVEITDLLIRYVKENDTQNAQLQLNYTLELVTTGYTTGECGVQIEMIDLLISAGAVTNGITGALTNQNLDAARHLLSRGGELTLIGAVCLDLMDDVNRLMEYVDDDEKLIALASAAFYGKCEMITYLLDAGVKPNGYPPANSDFHHHATPLHQAVSSGSLAAVKLLVEAGADLTIKDKVYDRTPFDWAEYMQGEEGIAEQAKKNYLLIADYLQKQAGGK